MFFQIVARCAREPQHTLGLQALVMQTETIMMAGSVIGGLTAGLDSVEHVGSEGLETRGAGLRTRSVFFAGPRADIHEEVAFDESRLVRRARRVVRLCGCGRFG